MNVVMSVLYIVLVKASMLKKYMISWGQSSRVSIWDRVLQPKQTYGTGVALGTKNIKRMVGVQTLL